jgi:tRNA-dihydrouridine synthase A
MARMQAAGLPWGHASRHMMGLRNGQPGARRWRQVWSDPRLKSGPPQAALALARAALDAAAAGTEVPA